MKGIILAGGTGSRLYPLTLVTSKQLLPVYDKPMIYYPLSTLMLAGIRDILIISTEQDVPNFQLLLGDGNNFGLNLSYKVQKKAEGLAQAFIIGEDFIGDDPCAMILGDNIFHNTGLSAILKRAAKAAENGSATIFGYYVKNPSDFGIVEFNDYSKVISIEEKPVNPKSDYAVTGLYFYPPDVVSKAKQVKPSARNELEITDLNIMYMKEDRLNLELFGRGCAWMDAGTMDSLYEASTFVKILEDRQGIQVAALEEIAYYNKWITKAQLQEAVNKYGKSPYGLHLEKVLNKKLKY